MEHLKPGSQAEHVSHFIVRSEYVHQGDKKISAPSLPPIEKLANRCNGFHQWGSTEQKSKLGEFIVLCIETTDPTWLLEQEQTSVKCPGWPTQSWRWVKVFLDYQSVFACSCSILPRLVQSSPEQVYLTNISFFFFELKWYFQSPRSAQSEWQSCILTGTDLGPP